MVTGVRMILGRPFCCVDAFGASVFSQTGTLPDPSFLGGSGTFGTW